MKELHFVLYVSVFVSISMRFKESLLLSIYYMVEVNLAVLNIVTVGMMNFPVSKQMAGRVQ